MTEEARRSGGDVDRLWDRIGDGCDLLRFAGVVGVDPRVVAGVAWQALSDAHDLLGEDDHSYEIWPVLSTAEAVLAGTRPERALEEAGRAPYDRMVEANSGPRCRTTPTR